MLKFNVFTRKMRERQDGGRKDFGRFWKTFERYKNHEGFGQG
jgi:hypothetical protein